MPVIVTCSCNAKLKVPEEHLGQRLRCPRCQAEVETPLSYQGMILPQGETMGVGSSCPTCQTTIEPGEVSLACPECKQVHHRECWAEVGGCSTYGCPKAPALVKETAEGGVEPPRTAWGDTKKCPACAETIKSIALKCRYCGMEFDTADPLTIGDLKKKDRRKEKTQGIQQTVWTLFILSLVGCLAPLMFFVNLIWFLNNRREVSKAGPFYTVVCSAALAITLTFSVLILIFAVFSKG